MESASSDASIFGIWESSSRFIEISPEGRMRIVLKPYYAFVYEDAGWIPCQVSEESAFGDVAVYTLSVSYPGQRAPQAFSAAVIDGESLYTGFFIKEEEADAAPNAQATGQEDPAETLSGFWVYCGSADGIKLYGESPAEDFFCLYFDGSRYYRIRYWLTDARFTPLRAVFSRAGAQSQDQLSVPKFLYRGGFLYTCVTGTGTTLRSYEQGTWELLEGAISFYADKIVFAESRQSETALVRFSGDGEVMLLGKPQFARSKISDMDAEIAEHNLKRRPQRKPPVEFMDLDFHWDEIEKLRQ